MEVVGESVPIVYFDELSPDQRVATMWFAVELALRFDLINHQASNLVDIEGVLGAHVPRLYDLDPDYNLAGHRLEIIEEYGVDPLKVLPGSRPG